MSGSLTGLTSRASKELALTISGWHVVTLPIAFFLFLVAGLWRVANPEIWWDEGWTLTVARTWVEHNHYGRLQDGIPSAAGLAASFPTTGAVALSFKLVGIGLWQGRVPGLLYSFGALTLMYYLARELYDRKVAVATLFVLLLMPASMEFHPLLQGRRVLAEMPMLFYLLAGYAGLHLALCRSPLWLPLPILMWSIGLWAKAQPLPFWCVSLGVPLIVCVLARRWRLAALLAVGFAGTYVTWLALPAIVFKALGITTQPDVPLDGLYDVLVRVTQLRYRLLAIQIVLIFGFPAVLGLCYAAWRVGQGSCRMIRRRVPPGDESRLIVRLGLLSFAGSWMTWYLCLALSVPRYVFPALFVSGMFVAVLIGELSSNFQIRASLRDVAEMMATRRYTARAVGACLAIVLLSATVPPTLQTLYAEYQTGASVHAQKQVAAYLNTNTAADAIIETYHSPFLFFLDRRYHYPPDQSHVQIMRHVVLEEPFRTPAELNSIRGDYLVLDSESQDWRLYQSQVDSGDYQMVQRFGQYQIYKRIR